MCLQDIAIGQRLSYEKRVATMTFDGQLILKARKDRYGFAWARVPVNDGTVLIGSYTPGNVHPFVSSFWAGSFSLAATTPTSGIVLARDYGPLVTDEVYVIGPFSEVVYFWDIYPLENLSEAVQKEVKRAF